MRIARQSLLALTLAPCLLVNTGCTSNVDTGPPGDPSKAYKSSDEAAKDMMKNMPDLPKNVRPKNALPPPSI